MPVTLSRAPWRASSHSGANGDCVQVASPAAALITVRDSKNPAGPELAFSARRWKEFIAALRNHESYRKLNSKK
jgi:predicted secreted Zn-dependent protease